MCGIAGISLSKGNQILQKRFRKMRELLKHRGPDGDGIFENKNISLIHTRLSIIDIKNGAQPIKSKNNVLVANGEIYNDLEIRKKYTKFKFSTKSDSESILALYENEGVRGFEKLRGMYSFALYDKNLDQLIISRDEFGIKPIYFSTMIEGFFFSSELNALKMIIPEKKLIDEKKVIEHLKFQYCSGNRTIYKGINRLRPGESLIIKKGKIIRSIFKKLTPKKNIICTEKYVQKKILDTVSSHLRSDVPYCLFFSGGIDSMLLLYSIKALGIKNIKAYTINFVENKKKKSFNLENICKENNIELHSESFSEEDFWNNIFFAAENIDEPLADYAILPTFKLAKRASKEFKIAITGEGGDELFAGYGRYKKTKRLLFSKKINKGLFSSSSFFKDYSNLKLAHHDKQNYFDFDNLSSIQNSQIFDYKNWLPNNLLVKLDRCLMTYGMEGRTPFIDKDLFNSLFHVSDNDKVRNGFGKYYIRNLLSKKISNYNAFAPKQGFTVPIYEWIPKKINLIEKHLLKLKFLSPFFSREQLLFLCKNIKKNKKIVKSIWHIIFFSSWYLIHVEGFKNKGNYFEVMKKVNGRYGKG